VSVGFLELDISPPTQCSRAASRKSAYLVLGQENVYYTRMCCFCCYGLFKLARHRVMITQSRYEMRFFVLHG